MTSTPIRDLLVGGFVIAGLAALAYLSVSLGGLSYHSRGGFALYASFDEIGGLTARAPVVIGGVRVGSVERIDLDADFRPRVELRMEPGLVLPDDSSAAILTQGVLGNQYISIEPGGSDDALEPGDEIAYTQSAVILEKMIGRVVQSLGE